MAEVITITDKEQEVIHKAFYDLLDSMTKSLLNDQQAFLYLCLN